MKILYSMLFPCLLFASMQREGAQDLAALEPQQQSTSDSCMYRWLEAKAFHARRVMLRDSVRSDSLYAILVVDLQKQNAHSMTLTMLISNHVAENIRQHYSGILDRPSMDQVIPISECVTVPCQVDVWDVGYVNVYESLNASIPLAALRLMTSVDTGIQYTAYICPLTNWTSTALQTYHIATRQSRTYHISTSPPYGGIRLNDDTCSFVEQLVDRITVGPFSMVMSRMLSDTMEMHRLRRPPRPKLDGPPIEILPPKK